MTIDKERLNREAIDMAMENAILRYKTSILAPALKNILSQCAEIKAKLIIEDSSALTMFHNLVHDIFELHNTQNQEDCLC